MVGVTATPGRLIALCVLLLPAAVFAQTDSTVSVRPFANITGEPSDAWIGVGIAETLIAALAGAPGFDVVTRESGAPRVLSGAYQRVGDRIRITATLVDVATGTVIRTARVDGALDDLFALQDRLILDLAEEEEATRRAARPPADTVASAPLTVSALGVGILIDGPPAPIAPEVMTRDERGRTTIRAIRLDEEITLDGQLDEPVYDNLAVTDFIQQVPNEGAPATERTEAWVLFDDTNVYVSARVHDSAPESEWVANEMRRDTSQLRNNDTFTAFFDTFYDRRNGYNFYTNPLGARADQQFTNEGNSNGDWNPVWDVRTGRFDGGWTVEMEIPFKSLRYRPGRPQLWGIQMRRAIRRKNEWAHITRIPISTGGGDGSSGIFRVSAAATLVGLEPPPNSRTFEVKPYGIGGVTTDVNKNLENDPDGDFGVDVKYGLAQNLTADLTYNTDFAQVEVDEQQVNLTRFSLFFPEKREFFLEGRGIFEFASAGSTGGFRRRGGGAGGFGGGNAPTLFYSRRIGLEGGVVVPIYGGGRLTGQAGAFDVGALRVQTEDSLEAATDSTNFTVLRLRRDVLRRSSIGGLFTNRSVSLVGPGASQAYGVDATLAFFDNVSLVAYYAKTQTPGHTDRDNSYQGQFRYSGDRYGFTADHIVIEDNFLPEVGFVQRDNFKRTNVNGRFSPRPQGIESVRRFTFQGDLDYYITADRGGLESRARSFAFQTEFENSDTFGATLSSNYERLDAPFEIAPGVILPVAGYGFTNTTLSYRLGEQRRMSGNVSYTTGAFWNGDIQTVAFSRGRVNVLDRFSIEPTISLNWVDLPQGSFNTNLVGSRFNYAFNPRMFFSGLVQYNSSNDVVSANLRFRWEYSPGSELFVVYSEERNTESLMPDRFSELRNRGFVVKLNRLFRM